MSQPELRILQTSKLRLSVAILAACLAFLPILGFIFFKVSHALNWDEWDMIGVVTIEQLQKGLDLASLWEPHNEHRTLLLRLLTYLNAQLDLSTIRLMYLGTSLFFCCYWILWFQFLKKHLVLNGMQLL